MRDWQPSSSPLGLGGAFRPCENLRIFGDSLKPYRGYMCTFSQSGELELSCFVMQAGAS